MHSQTGELLSLLNKQLQLDDVSAWDPTYKKFHQHLSNCTTPHGVFFDMDGVLAAEVIGEGSLAVLVTSFFDKLQQMKSSSHRVSPSEAHPILSCVYSIALMKECGFLEFLDSLWQSLCFVSGVTSSQPKESLTAEDFNYLRILYAKRDTVRFPSAYLCMKWVVQSSPLGPSFCSNLPPLKLGIENYKKVKGSMKCIVGVLTSVPGSVDNIAKFGREVGAKYILNNGQAKRSSNAQKAEFLEKMNRNNKLGKELWVAKHFSEEDVIVVVLSTQTKKEALKEKYGHKPAEDSKLIDDYDKNTKLFGANGFLIASAGSVRLQQYLPKFK